MSKRFIGKRNLGFTLIELLVVIAIIGILSSVVLASLNTARGKGADAAAKSNLNNMRAQAEIVYDNGSSSYLGVCADPNVIKAMAAARTTEGAATWATTADNLSAGGCVSSANAWVAWVLLAKGATPTNLYCVDSTGSSYQKTAAATTYSAAAPVSCGTSAGGAW